MVNKSYIKGYNFERTVQAELVKDGWVVVRRGKSSFPDLVCLKPKQRAMFIECKMNKYLSKEEKERAKELLKIAPFFVAWKTKDGKIQYTEVKSDGGKDKETKSN